MSVNLKIPELGNKFQDYRDEIPGDSYGWGLAIKPTDIRYLTIHHSVTKQTAKVDGDWKKECNVIANEHIKPVEQGGRGWGGVGYRFIICSDGTIAYVGDLEASGSAVGDHNDITFSACMVGDFTKELPTAAQVHSAHLLAKFFLTQMPAYPNLNDWTDVVGHKEFAVIFNQPQWATACPGSNWKVAGDNLYSRIVSDKWQGYPDPQPSGIQIPPQPTPQLAPQPSDCEQKLAKVKEITWSKRRTALRELRTLLPQ